MKAISLTVFFMLIFSSIFSQNENISAIPKFGYIFSESSLFGNFSDLNLILETNKINQLENNIGRSSFGIYFRNAEKSSYSWIHFGHYNAKNKSENENLDSDLKGWDLNFGYNYNLLKNNQATLLYPKIGFGLTNYQLDIINTSYSNSGFTQLIDSLSGSATFKSNQIFYTDLGLGFEKRLRVQYIDIYLGLNLSYVINFNHLKWKTLQEIEVNSMPTIKTNGFKINFVGRFEINWKKFEEHNSEKINNFNLQNN
jgi:hypothetical protein